MEHERRESCYKDELFPFVIDGFGCFVNCGICFLGSLLRTCSFTLTVYLCTAASMNTTII